MGPCGPSALGLDLTQVSVSVTVQEDNELGGQWTVSCVVLSCRFGTFDITPYSLDSLHVPKKNSNVEFSGGEYFSF